jgi:hypothetical protein
MNSKSHDAPASASPPSLAAARIARPARAAEPRTSRTALTARRTVVPRARTQTPSRHRSAVPDDDEVDEEILTRRARVSTTDDADADADARERERVAVTPTDARATTDMTTTDD